MIVFQRLLNDNGAKWALAIIAVYILLGVFAPIVTPYDPNTVN
ncbi:peptide ABC transporter permease, partial [Staphylococcus pseudintermedius]